MSPCDVLAAYFDEQAGLHAPEAYAAGVIAALRAAGYTIERDWQQIESAPRAAGAPAVLLWGGGEMVHAHRHGGASHWRLVHIGAWAEDDEICIDPAYWRPVPAGPEGG